MDYQIIEGAEHIDLDAVMRLLKMTYWACNRSREQVETAMAHSDCYGVRVDGQIVGFARVITDRATTFYLADVIIDEAYRGHGLGKALVGHILSRPAYDGLRGLLLTQTAHGLYAKYGFEVVENRAMTRSRKD